MWISPPRNVPVHITTWEQLITSPVSIKLLLVPSEVMKRITQFNPDYCSPSLPVVHKSIWRTVKHKVKDTPRSDVQPMITVHYFLHMPFIEFAVNLRSRSLHQRMYMPFVFKNAIVTQTAAPFDLFSI